VSFQPRTTISDPRSEPAPTRGATDRLRNARGVSATSPLVDANAAAKLLGVPPSWLLAQARERRVPHHKLGHYVRFDLDELIAWLDETRISPDPNPAGAEPSPQEAKDH
jgi:excisionase family DNA binding protein